MKKKDFLYIPKRLNVGFNKRIFRENDWENNRQKAEEEIKLGFITYWDEKGVLRKKVSWEEWRDKSLGNLELENEPLHGFAIHLVRNGYRGEWFSGRDAKILLKHPNGFVFEITPENACSLIIEGGVEAETGIIGGEQVLAWDGKELILLGTKSREYKESSLHTQKIDSGGFSDSNLTPGHLYRCRNGELRLYFGKPDYYTVEWKNSKEKPSGEGWLLVNPYLYNWECKLYWKRNILHHGEHVSIFVRENEPPSVESFLYSVKSMRKTMVDDLGEYKEWKELLNTILNRVLWHGETYIDPIVEYREEELSKEEFSEHLRAYTIKHANDTYHNSFTIYSKTKGEEVSFNLKHLVNDVDKLLLGEVVQTTSRANITLDDIISKYKPTKITSITKNGRVVEWNSFLLCKEYSYTEGAGDFAGKLIERTKEENTFPPVII